MVRRDRVGDVLQQHGFAGARWRYDQTALSLAEGREQIHDAGADVLAGGFELEAFLRIKRRQVVEENLVARFIWRFEVDGFNLDQGEILFAFVRRANLAADGVAGLEVKLTNLRRRNINVVGAGKVVVIGRAQEAVAVGQDFEHSFREDVAFFFALGLKDFEDQVLLAQSTSAGQIQGSGDLGQLCNIFFFQFCDGHYSMSPAKGIFKRGVTNSGKTWPNRGQAGGLVLRSPPLCLGEVFRLRQNRLPLRACNLVQNLVHGFLDSGVGLVKLTGSLGCKLTEHITIPQSM